MQGGWAVFFLWSGVLLSAVGLAGCQAGGSDESSAATAVQAVEDVGTPIAAGTAADAATAPECAEDDEDVFTGTNLLAGVWAKLQE